MVLTDEQQQAVSIRNKNLLVAAAAGSGKTRVLIERIKKMILDGECDVDKLLIVTFTNAAAAEMRTRLHSALKAELKVKTDMETIERLERQLVLMSGASIMTLHAFCQTLLKRHFSKIDLDPKFRLADEQELNLIKQDVIAELFESKYESGDKNFGKFTDDFGGTERGDSKLYDLILDLYKFSQSQPYPEEWLQSLTESFNIDEDAKLKDTFWYDSAIKHIKFVLDAAYDECLVTYNLACANSIYVETIEDDLHNVLLQLKKAANSNDWQCIYNEMMNYKFQNLKAVRKKVDEDAKNAIQMSRDEYKTSIKTLRDKYFFATETEMIEDLRSMKPSIDTLIQVTLDFIQAYSAAKRDKNIIDFNDMEHLALKILSDKSTAAALRKKYHAVMVDEYQDTNGVQDAILTIISDPLKANFFAVGDVKQSIYRFRLADPTLFMDKYNSYPTTKDYAAQNDKAVNYDDCLRIDLSQNFRSRREVLNAVNFVFERLMTKEAMEIPYDKDARLNYGMDYTTDIGNTLDSPTEFYLINDNKSAPLEEDDDNAKYQEYVHNIEREAQVIADRIKNLIKSNTQIYDKDDNKYRTIKYRDIVVLLRSQESSANHVMDVFEKNEIPAYSIGDKNYFKALEIQIMVSLLTVLDNARQNIPLAAVMLSPIGGFNASELASLRIASRYEDFITVLTTAAASTPEMNPLNLPVSLLKKSVSFLQKLNTWRELAKNVSVPELVSTIYRETGYYDYVGGLPEGVLRQANLRMLVDRATAYEATSYRGLSRFLKFIKKIKELNTDLSVARTLGENEDVVRIMTIHKSKGLEFPVVFVAGLGKTFNLKDEKVEILVKHRKLGIGSYKILKNEPLRYPTFARQVISEKNVEEQKAEELRILYVAMTRAREKLILIGTAKNIDKKIAKYKRYENSVTIPGFAALSANSFLDWIMLAMSKETDCIITKNIEASQIRIADKSKSIDKPEVKADMTKLAKKPTISLEKYIPSKMSVTEIKRRMEYNDESTKNLFDKYDKMDKQTYYRRPDFEQTKNVTGVEYGLLMHSVMQRLDLNGDLSYNGINKQIELMTAQNIFTIEQAKIISRKNIAKFFASAVGKKMISSNEVYRELPFIRLVDISKFYPNVSDKIFIQGIIDVLFRDEDKFILLDYKTDRAADDEAVTIENMKEKYQLQIDLYSEAIEAVLQKPIAQKYLYMLNSGLLISM